MAGIIKVNQYQDFNGNTLFTSDGNGNLTTMKTNYPAFYASLSSTTNVTNATATKVVFDTEHYDTDSAYDTSNGTFTVPSGKAGKYLISSGLWCNQTGGEGELYLAGNYLYKNGSLFIQCQSDYNTTADDSANNVNKSLVVIIDLSVGDYIEIYARVGAHSGTAQLLTTNRSTWFSGYRIGS